MPKTKQILFCGKCEFRSSMGRCMNRSSQYNGIMVAKNDTACGCASRIGSYV